MNKLQKLVKHIKGRHVYVQMHNYPDQDALASAMGVQAILKTEGIEATICYKGQIDKFNTLKMIEMLNIEIHNINDLKMKPDDEIIIVDGQKGNINVEDFVGEEIGCIDHHQVQDTNYYRFYDIRSDVGACATIIASYFVENQIEMSEEIATALVYGIKVDTANLSRGVTDLDIDMFCYLYKRANISILRKFDNCSLKIDDLQAYVKAISDLRLYGSIGVANIGNDCSEAIIGTVSDFLLSLTEIDVTLVYSYRAGGLKISIRSEVSGVEADKIIRKALSAVGGGGGGHSSMAAGFIPDLKSEYQAKTIARVVEHNIIEMVQNLLKEKHI